MKTLFIIPLLAITGCMSVPTTHIKGAIAGQPFDIETPKDSTLAGLDISVATNAVHLHIDTLQARMNPDVITTTGDAQAKMISAASQAGAAIAGAAVQAAK